ncbi:MAG: hypothetical protein Q8L53_03910 [Aestuariivirga sp.]|nr:hypothetical protein [Aestuariivirga sp.]
MKNEYVEKEPPAKGPKQKNIGALGEELVKYHLLARGWDVINLNLIGNNKPNADLLAVKGKQQWRIQVKTSQYIDWVQLGWLEHGKTVINSKLGDPADFFALVAHRAPGDYKIFVIPVSHMKDWERRNLKTHFEFRRTKNSGYVYLGAKLRKTKFNINRSGEEFQPFLDGWKLLGHT